MQVHSEYIDRAISSLTALRDRKITTSVKSQEDELDSYYAARDVAKDAHGIYADLIIALCEIASECSPEKISETDRRNFRDAHLIDDVLYAADLWAEKVQENLSAPAEYSTINSTALGLSPGAGV